MAPEPKPKKALCPSYRMEAGAVLLGVVGADGLVDYLDELVLVTPEFIEVASEGRNPEQRFRFSGNCIQGGCGQWSTGESKCGLIDKVIQGSSTQPLEGSELPDCVIRPSCRWFGQQGASACAVCPEVTRDLSYAPLELNVS